MSPDQVGVFKASLSPGELTRKRLWDELVMLGNIWEEYQFLFLASPRRVDLLNKSAGWFFGQTQRFMLQSVILGISRLTDPLGSGQRVNLSLAVLLTDPKIDEAEPQLRQALHDRIEALRLTAEPIRERRNKAIAHLDHAVAVGEGRAKVVGFKSELVTSIVTEAQGIFHLHGRRLYDIDSDFDAYAPSGAQSLVRLLELGYAAEQEWLAKMDKREL